MGSNITIFQQNPYGSGLLNGSVPAGQTVDFQFPLSHGTAIDGSPVTESVTGDISPLGVTKKTVMNNVVIISISNSDTVSEHDLVNVPIKFSVDNVP